MKRRRTRRPVETPEYIRGFLTRAIRGAGKRVAEADPEDLADLLELRAEFEAVVVEAVRGMRQQGVSWSAIGRALGTTKQAAQATYGRKIAAADAEKIPA